MSAKEGAPPLSTTPKELRRTSTPANGTPFPAASILASVNPEGVPPYGGPRGVLEGTIRVRGDSSPDVPIDSTNEKKCPEARAKDYAKVFRSDALVGDERGLLDALVFVTGFNGFVAETRETARVVVEGCQFEPRTLDVTYGQRIEVSNRTHSPLAPQLADSRLPALTVATPNGDAVKLYPVPGATVLGDRLGPSWMRAHVYTLLHPLHTVSGHNGKFRIEHVPIGKMAVHVRHPAFGEELSREVEIREGAVASVDVAFEYRAGAAAVPNRSGR